MKPMLPQLHLEAPTGKEWVYETKYDGFRAILYIHNESIQLKSRNDKDLLFQFPEVGTFIKENWNKFKPYLPVILDGELCILQNNYKADFYKIQKRGRLRSEDKIFQSSKELTSKLLIFDALMISGVSLTTQPYKERKQRLKQLFEDCSLPNQVDFKHPSIIQMIMNHTTFSSLWEQVKKYDGEGVVAKYVNSKWEEGKRSNQWIKIKNWKQALCFITSYEKSNGFFHIGVYEKGNVRLIGLFKNGLSADEQQALLQVVKNNSKSEDSQFIYVPPAICVELNYLELYEGQLREVHFSTFRFDLQPMECTWEKLTESKINLPENIEITHPDKPLWEKKEITKIDYISYLRTIYPYMEPFLYNRTLTVIRYPHGMFGEAFFQKNCPDYAPDFVRTHTDEGIRYIVCDQLDTFIWLGNQLAIEFHIPFTTIDRHSPSEIVIDLDPPTRKEFPRAVEAAMIIQEIFQSLGITGFLKVSGNRGLQIYVPLQKNSLVTWEDSRMFTHFIATYLISKNEKSFTIERLKKNRGNRLYIDYVQHAQGKTIICPYSLRGNENAGVAAPIYWEELNDSIQPDGFSMKQVLERTAENGCPFSLFFDVDNEQPLQQILSFLKKKR